jgi:murein DD-endopeptidase MepM/ murein hydrolase activator NlpD
LKHALVQAAHDITETVTALVQKHPRRVVATVAALLLSGTGATFAVANLSPDPADLPVRAVIESITPPGFSQAANALETQALTLYRSGVTRSNDTAEIFLKRVGVVDARAAAFLRSDAKVQQWLLGRTGRNVTVEADADNHLLTLTARWSPEDDGMFKRLTVQKTTNGFASVLETLPMTASSRLAGGTITSSLFAATDDARIPDAVAIQLAEIFSGDIDFHRALRKGDRFSVVYETLEGDGEPLRAGRVLSAEFVNAGKTHQAMWFQEPGAEASTHADSNSASHKLTKGGYYTLAGESLRRAYLASPLEFSRVTSGFQMRFHPILKTWRAHLGVDYGAATGTPVRTVGDGVVDFAGVQNGFGNVVVVRHQQGHQTLYAHLSKINVRNGQAVSQGQNVGLVGATGWATGPHLHFEFRINGVHRDPQVIARQSESVPVAASLKPVFERSAVQVRAQLAAAATLQSSSVE